MSVLDLTDEELEKRLIEANNFLDEHHLTYEETKEQVDNTPIYPVIKEEKGEFEVLTKEERRFLLSPIDHLLTDEEMEEAMNDIDIPFDDMPDEAGEAKKETYFNY